MDSKNNNDRHRFEREYFDAPHAYLHRGFQFKSVYTKPHLLTSAGRIASNAGELESPLTLQTATSRHLSVLDPGSPYKVKNPEILPVTLFVEFPSKNIAQLFVRLKEGQL